MAFFGNYYRTHDFGLLVLRVGIGVMFTIHGYPKLVGGQLLALGLFFRITCGLLLATMVMATLMHLRSGDGFNGYAHALESTFLFLGLAFAGPGRYSLDQQLFPSRRRLY